MRRGTPAVYISLAGQEHAAEVLFARHDGTVDLAVDAGANHPLELSRIAVDPAGKPGTCRIEGGAQ